MAHGGPPPAKPSLTAPHRHYSSLFQCDVVGCPIGNECFHITRGGYDVNGGVAGNERRLDVTRALAARVGRRHGKVCDGRHRPCMDWGEVSERHIWRIYTNSTYGT